MKTDNPDYLVDFIQEAREDAAANNLRENFAWNKILNFFDKNNIGYETPIDNFHNTILHLAINAEATSAIKSILAKNPEIINNQNIIGQTPLFLAAQNNQSKIFEYLIKNGADKNIGDDNEVYPIHMASYHCNSEMFFYFKQDSITNVEDAKNTIDSLGRNPIYYLFARDIPEYNEKTPIDTDQKIDEFSAILKNFNLSEKELLEQCNQNSDDLNYFNDFQEIINYFSRQNLSKTIKMLDNDITSAVFYSEAILSPTTTQTIVKSTEYSNLNAIESLGYSK